MGKGGGRWSEQDKPAAIALIKTGNVSYGTIAKCFGRSKHAITGLARRAGLADPDNNPIRKTAWSGAELDRLHALHRQGLTVQRMASRLGRAPCGVRRQLTSLGLQEKPAKAAVQPPKAGVVLPPTPVAPARTCQWIEGDVRRVWQFCGAPSMPGFSWCRAHKRRVYQTHPKESGSE